MYQKDKDNMIMIPRWKYDIMSDTCTRVDVLLREVKAEEDYDKELGYGKNTTIKTELVKRILAPHREKQHSTLPFEPTTEDDLADAGVDTYAD